MIKAIFRNGRSLFFSQQSTILSAASVIMFVGLLSRILGLVRDRVLANFFSPQSLDVYFAAARIPNIIFDLVVAGTLSAAFIPVFSEYLSRDEKEQAFAVSSAIITLSLGIFLILTLLYLILASPISSLIAPGFHQSQIALMANLTRVMLIAQIFFILASFFAGIAHSFKRFIIPALALALYNIGIIWGTALFAKNFGLYGPALGMITGAFLYLLVQLPLMKNLGAKFRLSFDYQNKGVRRIARLMAPKMVGIFVAQIDATVDVMLASLSTLGALTYFSFAQHLQFFPVGLFGLTIAQATLPTLSLEAGGKNIAEFKRTFLSALHQMLFLVIPSGIAVLVLRIPLVRLAFGAARFDWEATVVTGYVLAAFAISIAAQSMVYFFSRGFYALQDTLTPVKIQIFSTVLGISLAMASILKLGLPIWSVALSYSLATFLHTLLLLIFLNKKVGGFDLKKLLLPPLKISAASLTSGSLMYIFLKILDRSAWDQRLSFLGRLSLPAHFEVFVIDTRYTVNLIILTTIVGVIGVGVYLLMVKLLKVEEARVFLKLLRKFKPSLIK